MPLLRDIKGSFQPFWVTLRNMFRKPVTVQYPEQRPELPERYRARLILTRDPDGAERCVACYLCSAACPVDCISLQAAEAEDGRRYAAWFRLNFARCIFCGLCTEACPTLAIQVTADFELAGRDPLKLVYEKEDLLVDHCGRQPDYNFYRQTGIGVTAPRGGNPGESPPVDVKDLLP
ncbi:MAG: NADH-quinone oxidoreductase subunit NuoI [Deltaproteobacteria bacterium]|nr:NADH-quinone oxidoreductase subunit NuoI [Deltaproteobacteria bacterium]